MQYIKNIVILFALGVGLNSNAQQRFSEVEGINNNAWTNHVIVDGNTYVAGTYSASTTYSKYTLTRRDENGNVLLSKDLDVRADSELNSTGHLIKLSDGNFLLASVYRSLSDANVRKIYAISFTPTFDTLWTKTYTRKATNDDISYINSVTELSDGYIFVGASRSDDGSETYPYSFKTDKNGSTLWEQFHPTTGRSIFWHVISTTDEDCFIIGYLDRDNPDVNAGYSREAYLLKVDAVGNKVWDTVYRNPTFNGQNIVFWDMTSTQDGNFLILSQYASKIGSDGWVDEFDSYLIKINPNGEIIWDKYVDVGTGHDTHLSSVSEADDGTILLGGESTIGGGGLKGLFYKLTPLGEVVWEHYYRYSTRTGDHYIGNIAATDDGGVVGCGTSSLPQDGWLIKLDCNGCLDATCVDDGVSCTTYNCADDAQPEALFTVPAPPYQALPGESYTLNIRNKSAYSGAYEWYIDNVYQGDFVNPNFDLESGATYEIKLVAKNMTCSHEYVMNVTVDALLSTPSNSPQGGELSIYPNPTSGQLDVKSDYVIELIEITDVTGKVVYSEKLKVKNLPTGRRAEKLDISELAEGVYYLKVSFVDGSVNYRKVVKE